MPAHAPDERRAGAFRCRRGVSVAGDVLVSTSPLVATRLNDAALDVVGALDDDAFRAPAGIADATGHDARSVERLLEHLRGRGLLEWRPARDPAFRPPVSVVVTVLDDRERLERCLDALCDLDYPAYEVIVVDDGSTDGTREAVRARADGDDRLRLIEVGDPAAPLGIGASRNRGVEAARHDVVAFTDADCRPRSAWLADLVPHLAAHDVVGGRVRPLGTDAASAYERVNASLDMGPTADRVDPDGATPYLPTANLVGRRAVFEAVPFPDRDVAEDVDVCWRAIEAGYDVVYSPDGVVEHDYRCGVRSFAARRATYGASEALLAREYGGDRGESVSVPALLAFALVSGLVGIVGSGALARIAFAATGSLVALAVLADGWLLRRRANRLGAVVSARDVLASWGRERLSSAYALALEVTRYYAIPLALVGALAWVAGAPGLATGVLGFDVAAVALPLAVEYRVHGPDTSLAGYAVYYLADNLGYECGVYRGARIHRTLAHLRPDRRFRLAGPGSRRRARPAGRGDG